MTVGRMKELARTLRKNQTDAEKGLWRSLRNRQVLGCKFRRKQIIGPYIADFLSLEPKIVIEIDGGQHAERQDEDQKRTEYLQSLGYRVLRFWNHEVLREPDSVLEAIRITLIDLCPHEAGRPPDAGMSGPNSKKLG